MSNRRPAPPLLRPKRRPLRPVLIGLALSLIGVVGGVVIGLGLRPPSAPVPSMVTSPAPETVAGSTTPAAPSQSAEIATLTAEIAALRRAVAEEQARLEALIRARTAAEVGRLAPEAAARPRPALESPLPTPAPSPPPAQRPAAEASPPPPREPAQPRREAALPPILAPGPRPLRIEPPPATGQPRVFVHHRAGSAAGAEAAAALLGPLREGGFEVPDVRPSPAVPFQRVVRYFYAEDAAAAARLAGRLGRGWAIQDFRGYEPSPSPGTLEVWVPDR